MGKALTNEKKLVLLAAQWEHQRRQLSAVQAQITRQMQVARDLQSALENAAAIEQADLLWRKEQQAKAAFEAFLQSWYSPAVARSTLRLCGQRVAAARHELRMRIEKT